MLTSEQIRVLAAEFAAMAETWMIQRRHDPAETFAPLLLAASQCAQRAERTRQFMKMVQAFTIVITTKDP